MDAWLKLQVDKYSTVSFGEADKVVDRKRKAYVKLLSFAKPGMKFLDLGTNSGRVAHEMKKLGLKELGVDLEAVINKIKYPINKVAMDLEKEYPEGEWDLIFCRETIEHLRTYEEVCKKIIASLKPKGTLIITGPVDNRDFGKNCPEHVRIFANQELDKLVTRSGGNIVEVFNDKRSRVIVVNRK
jgi:2-polyprenyl-3-methyl-5-hydroxy-6-metoxy-1,4-benzoquinol methylase